MVTLAAAPQAMVTATRRMRRYCITESNAGALMKVPRVARGTGSRPFGQGHITHDGGRRGGQAGFPEAWAARSALRQPQDHLAVALARAAHVAEPVEDRRPLYVGGESRKT
jgi:hypothetical protein